MWISLTEGTFFFGSGGVTAMKVIDLRDKFSSYVYRTELYNGATRIAFVVETVEEINKMLNQSTKKSAKKSNDL